MAAQDGDGQVPGVGVFVHDQDDEPVQDGALRGPERGRPAELRHAQGELDRLERQPHGERRALGFAVAGRVDRSPVQTVARNSSFRRFAAYASA
jgi:hypothetical protein